MPKLARIGIDCRLSGSTHAGIGRYIEELILRLPEVAPQIEWVFFFFDQKQADEYLSHFKSPPQVKIVLAPIRHYSLAEQTKLPKIFRQEKLDLLHVPHFNVPIFYSGPLVVTIHDLLWHEFVGLQATTLNPLVYFAKYLAYRIITHSSINKARKIFVPANTIKDVVNKYYPFTKNKIIVTPEGFSATFSKPLVTKRKEKKLIYLGSLYPHKNVRLVLSALPHLPDYKLQLIGARNIFQDQTRQLVKKLGIENQVEFAGYLNDEKLKAEFANASALVQPSLSEGFGLTGIEAMASGLPVLASNIPIFNEIYADGAIYFDPKQVKSFVDSVRELEKTDLEKQVAKGLTVAKQYSWDKMAQLTWQGYQQT